LRDGGTIAKSKPKDVLTADDADQRR